jgi:hypothetical protein
MKHLFGTLILLFGLNAYCADWLLGRWEGFCQMSTLEKDGSQIWSYEFSGKNGALTVQEFEDNRCQKLKLSTNRPFKLGMSSIGQNQTLVKIDFEKSQAGQIASAQYAFEKYGQNRMGLNAIYLVKHIGRNGELETLVADKNGLTKFPTQSYSRLVK